jgi:thymidylate kinase
MIKGIILEGLSCSGKTSIFRELKKNLATNAESERSLVALGEHYSQALQKVNESYVLTQRDEHLKLLESRISIIENLFKYANSLGPASIRSRGLFFIFERFHLNHLMSYESYDKDEFVKLENRLLKLNSKCILLEAPVNELEERFSHSGT